jgi:hypothetical protein
MLFFYDEHKHYFLFLFLFFVFNFVLYNKRYNNDLNYIYKIGQYNEQYNEQKY